MKGFKDFLYKNKYAIGSALVVLLIAYILYKRKFVVVGKGGESKPREDFDADFYARKVNASLDGWAYNVEAKKEVFNDLLRLNDSEMILVYNVFNKRYGEGKTMRERISEEWINDLNLQELERKLNAYFDVLKLP